MPTSVLAFASHSLSAASSCGRWPSTSGEPPDKRPLSCNLPRGVATGAIPLTCRCLCRSCLEPKSAEAPLPVTAKLFENVLAGASPALRAGPADGSVQTLRDQPEASRDDAAAPSAASAGPEPSPSPTPLLQQQQPQLVEQLCAAYRVLLAVLLVPLVSHCLSASEEAAWTLLHSLTGEDEPEAPSEPPSDSAANSTTHMAANSHDGSPSPHANGGAHGPEPVASAPARYDAAEAADPDDDDFVFEAMDPSGGPPAAPSSAAGRAAAARQAHPARPPPPYEWPALRRRLLQLGGAVSYAALEEEALWADGWLLAGVLRLLRTLGAHRHAQVGAHGNQSGMSVGEGLWRRAAGEGR
jgi:hypothetical protein